VVSQLARVMSAKPVPLEEQKKDSSLEEEESA